MRPFNFSSVLAVALCLIANTLFGQIQVDPNYAQYSPVEYSLSIPSQNAQALWEVKALDGQTEYTSRPYEKEGQKVYCFWGQPGRYALEATVVIVDFDAKSFEIKKFNAQFRIAGIDPTPPVPPVPPTPPGPTPPTPPPVPPPSPVPNDEFDNLGQRLDGMCDQIGLQVDLRNRVAEVFANTATKMTESGTFIQLSDVKKYLEAELKKLGLDSSWDQTLALLREDAKSREPMSWEAAYNWYRAAAAGYRGGKLNTVGAVWYKPNKVQSPTNFVTSLPDQTIVVEALCPNGVCNVR